MDEPAGARSTAAGYNRNDLLYREATEAPKNVTAASNRGGGGFVPKKQQQQQQQQQQQPPPPPRLRPASASARSLKAKMAPLFRTPVRRGRGSASVVPFDDMSAAAKPPLAVMLAEAGFGIALIRKLCDDMSCTHVEHLLALDRPQFDALCDALRPAPGMRELLRRFLTEQRAKAEERRAVLREQRQSMEGDDGGGRDDRPTTAPPTPAQRRAWKSSLDHLRYSSVAAKRGNDGHVSHILQEQPTWWGKGNGAPPHSKAYVSGVRVLKIGGSRVTVFDGPRPNATGRRPQPGGGGPAAFGASGYGSSRARGGYDRDAF